MRNMDEFVKKIAELENQQLVITLKLICMLAVMVLFTSIMLRCSFLFWTAVIVLIPYFIGYCLYIIKIMIEIIFNIH